VRPQLTLPKILVAAKSFGSAKYVWPHESAQKQNSGISRDGVKPVGAAINEGSNPEPEPKLNKFSRERLNSATGLERGSLPPRSEPSGLSEKIGPDGDRPEPKLSAPALKSSFSPKGISPFTNCYERQTTMANYGNLARREKQNSDSSVTVALMGTLAVPLVMTGAIAIAQKDSTVGNEWPLDVKLHQDGTWASLGSAKFERKNDKSDWYIRIVLDGPILELKLGKPLWLRAFPKDGAKTDKPEFADEYDIVWSGSGGGAKKTDTSNSVADDEIPF